MKTEIKEEAKNEVSTVNIMRLGFDHYVPVEQICKFMNVEFEEDSKNIPDNLKVNFIDFLLDDGTKKNMKSIHIENLENYINWLKDKFTIEAEIISKFYIGTHKFHLDYESKLKEMLEESYAN